MGEPAVSTMREIEFTLLNDGPGQLMAQALEQDLQIAAPTWEELHHEARDALIGHLGPAHGTYRVKWRRICPNQSAGRSWGRSWRLPIERANGNPPLASTPPTWETTAPASANQASRWTV